jgi:hypothetical protein
MKACTPSTEIVPVIVWTFVSSALFVSLTWNSQRFPTATGNRLVSFSLPFGVSEPQAPTSAARAMSEAVEPTRAGRRSEVR